MMTDGKCYKEISTRRENCVKINHYYFTGEKYEKIYA